MTRICVSKLAIIGSDNGLSPDIFWRLLVPSLYLNQCWNIVNWTLRNKLQWILNRNLYLFIEENALSKKIQNFVLTMTAILPRPHCVKYIFCLETEMRHQQQNNSYPKISPTACNEVQCFHSMHLNLYLLIYPSLKETYNFGSGNGKDTMLEKTK